ncbi:hypothetical protein [Pedobacter gandavensis]|uniref:hypothetical protein n=1 Tax=Pedobacter gandavensis TaxID=2679963 RepID=UPI00292CFEE7|nr:hypothetical protein [Pedobacter gandavensis]
MNPDLLKKCLSGQASDAEWESYQSWINGDAEENDLENLDQEAEQVKNSILASILHKKEQQHSYSERKRSFAIAVGIAASLFCVLYLSFLFHSGPELQQAQVYKYDDQSAHLENNFNGIIVQLAKNSQASLNQQSSANINLHFLGSVMLSNRSSEDQHLTVQNHKDEFKKICLRKGHSYFLSYLNFNFEEIIMVDKQSMNEIPPAMAMNMIQQFDL